MPEATAARLHADIVGSADELAALRRDIHAHPELGFEEQRTSDLVAAQLAGWGIPLAPRPGATGVVGIVHGRDGGACGRAIGLRADMDALPVHEANPLPMPAATPA
jgi:metal-dependent amidase/aminoacylase/carboxypeptidase family protein